MKQLILVSHGSFADGLKTSLAMFAGDKIDQVMAVGLKEGEDVDDLAAEFSRRLEENNIDSDTELIVLADIVGGSPLTTVCNVLEKRGLLEGAVILGGMNLPMALNSGHEGHAVRGRICDDRFVRGTKCCSRIQNGSRR